jgi:hypothetical protein
LSFDDLTFICQQLNEKLNRTLSAGVDVNNFNNTFPVKAGMSFRINDAGDGLVLTEDPARVLPLAKDVLEQTKIRSLYKLIAKHIKKQKKIFLLTTVKQ